jgi:hypothetical protein
MFYTVVVLTFIPTSGNEGSFSMHPRQHLLLVVFLMIAILAGVRLNLSVVLI